MSLELDIQNGIKAAMLAKEKVKLEALRGIKAAILLAKTADGSETISDDAVLKIIQKLVKQRKESAELYKAQKASGTVRREGLKIYPNDPCPCGSGKKYKKCCGRNK